MSEIPPTPEKNRAHRSRMKRILSFANRPTLDKHENPNSANMKKNAPEPDGHGKHNRKLQNSKADVPSLFWNPPISFDTFW